MRPAGLIRWTNLGEVSETGVSSAVVERSGQGADQPLPRPGRWDEARAAEYYDSIGQACRLVEGRYWRAQPVRHPEHFGAPGSAPGRAAVFRPVDLLAPVERVPRRRDFPDSLGFLAIAPQGPTTLPLNVIPDVQSYGRPRLSRARWGTLRMSRNRCDTVQLTDPDLLLDQGLAVEQSAAGRTGQSIDGSATAFRDRILSAWEAGPEICVAATCRGRLGGFLTGHCIGARGYFTQVVMADWALRWGAGTAMYWAMIHLMKSQGVQEIMLGYWVPELRALAQFKRSMGSRVQQRPAASSVNRLAMLYARLRLPASYARLGGSGWARPHGFDRDDDTTTPGAGRG